MTILNLGRLSSVPVRSVWTDEARDFTPWLAEAENLSLLGEAIGLMLELEARERRVGPFAADILARDVARDRWVLVENQLEATDHRHLGQLLTYAAGLEAMTVVWVAPEIREEHRAAIDWLNHITSEGFDFFAIQVEAFRIGDSACAPRFSVIAKPNDWSRKLGAARRESTSGAAPQSQKWITYWEPLLGLAKGRVPYLADKAVSKANWQPVMSFNTSKDLTFAFNLTSPRGGLRVELYIDRLLAKAAFRALEAEREDIQSALGCEVAWELLPDAQASRVCVYRPNDTGADIANPGDQYEWFLTMLPRFVDVLKPRVDALDPEQLRQVDQLETESAVDSEA
jgi:hypothetical protein